MTATAGMSGLRAPAADLAAAVSAQHAHAGAVGAELAGRIEVAGVGLGGQGGPSTKAAEAEIVVLFARAAARERLGAEPARALVEGAADLAAPIRGDHPDTRAVRAEPALGR